MISGKKHFILNFLLKALQLALLIALTAGIYGTVRDCWREYNFYNQSHTDAEMAVKKYAEENGLNYAQYPESLIQLLDRNPETETFVLEYPQKHGKDFEIDLPEYEALDSVPLFLQWDQRWGYRWYGGDVAGITGCGPICLSMAGYYVTGDQRFSPDRVLDFALWNGYCVPGNGTSWSLISEGGEKLGLDVTEIPLDENRIVKNLEVDNPIICIMGPGDFTTTGHYIVMVGYEDGMIRVNDPNSREKSEKLWDYDQIKDQIRNLWVIRAGA